jgi:hypothetical protein
VATSRLDVSPARRLVRYLRCRVFVAYYWGIHELVRARLEAVARERPLAGWAATRLVIADQ